MNPHSPPAHDTAQDDGATTRIPAAEPRLRGPQKRLALSIFHPDGLQVAVLSPGVPVIVGRSAPADIRIADRSLSRAHCRFVLGVDDRVIVTDLRSTNGSWVVGSAIETAELQAGSEVLLGRVVVRVHALGPDEGPAGIGDEAGFRAALEDAITSAKKADQKLSVLFVRSSLHLPAEDTHTVAPGDVCRWAHRAQTLLKPGDRIARARRDAVVIFLLGRNSADAHAEMLPILRGAAPHEPSLLIGIASFPETSIVADKLLDQARQSSDMADLSNPIHIARHSPFRSDATNAGSGPVLASEIMRKTIALVDRAAAARVPVVLHGETGTGKEVLARYLHEQSQRRDRPMVSINCAAIPSQLVESTLFGHERGAFTGALSAQKGVFEAADGGTVFLDEVGELSLSAQAALLRVLETQRLTRVGSTREISVDIRVVAATHRDLATMAHQGQFRPDLYYRLATMVITVPPLRQRREDIPALVARFLSEREKAGTFPAPTIRPEALALLMDCPFPGNVRELRNAIERALVVSQNGIIEPLDLPEHLREKPAQTPEVRAPLESQNNEIAFATLPPQADLSKTGADVDLRSEMMVHERKLLTEMLVACDWNKTKAAQRLGLPIRTLTYKMTALGIQRPER